ncbi:phytanoyl-dioxygenase family protein [Grosmannia clavigera kw1407]|uniref:Phytanoyl-dioxygenase family protein n=1 Tax=Grosmannia clavigera (strain kw1407 / UAMH 11150) TaxID=655863 RepID=F0X6P5_GROCL|nr:phytanoyl-dioxygenase family protein [Grosmannia clavigera kw1407]EFX06701.1 phytanoyl-dioxygenase family protein [Grosmannia clavigera kw1407]
MVQRISRATGLQAFINAIEKDGCVVIQDFTDLESLATSVREIQPYLDASAAEAAKSTVGALNGGTAICTRLIGRSKTVREKFFADPLYQALADHILGLETTVWMGGEPAVHRSDPLLSISIAMSSQPGSSPQLLHRDDKNHHARHTAASKYTHGRDMLLGLFVPTCDTFQANGATRIVPGSHLWGDDQPDFGPSGDVGVEDAELKRGEAFVMLGSLYHGAGKYTMSTGCRTVHIMFMCSGVYRQEEIPFLSYPIEDVMTYSKLVQDRLGWKQSEPNLGWVDLKSPEFLLM